MYRIVLASEAVTILRQQLASRPVLLAGAFCFIGVFLLTVQLQRQGAVDWKRLVAILLLTTVFVGLLLMSPTAALVVSVILAGGATLALGGVAVKIVVHLVQTV